jgi:hypothetical protein
VSTVEPFPDRPRPLMTVADRVATITGLAGTLATAGVGFGLFSWATGNAITGLLGLVPGVAAGIAAVIAAYRTAAHGERLVTPSSDPQDGDGNRLRPVVVQLAPDPTRGETR